MNIQRKKLSELNPAPYNPREKQSAGDFEFDKLCNSIKEFGNAEPIIWNKRTGNIVGGHMLYDVLIYLGETETQVVEVDLPLEEEKLLNLTLNKVQGQWDYVKLTELLSEFDHTELKLSGFSPAEITLLIAEETDTSGYDEEEDGSEDEEEYDDSDDEAYPEEHISHSEQPARGSYDVSDDENDEDEEEDDEEEGKSTAHEVAGVTYVLEAKFNSRELANEWLNMHDFIERIKPSLHSVVIRAK